METGLLYAPSGRARLFGLVAHTGIDVALIAVSFRLAYVLRYQYGLGGTVRQAYFRPFHDFLPLVLLLAVATLGIFGVRGIYRAHSQTDPREEMRLVGSSTILAFCLLVVFVHYSQVFAFSRLVLLYALLLELALLTARVLAGPTLRAWALAHEYQLGHAIDIAFALTILLLGLVPMLLVTLPRRRRALRAPDTPMLQDE